MVKLFGAKLIIKSKVSSLNSFDTLSVFAGPSPEAATSFIGGIAPTKDLKTTVINIPIEVITQDYTSASVFLENNTVNNFLIFDTYFLFDISDSSNVLDTTNSVSIYGYGVPFLESKIETNNSVKLKRGKHYGLDFYTEDLWWDIGKIVRFNYKDWNCYEEILNKLGRSFHSCLMFCKKSPNVKNYVLKLQEDSLPISEDDISIQEISGGFSIKSSTSIDSIFVSPNFYVKDTSVWVFVPSINEKNIEITFFEFDGADYLIYSGTGCPFSFDSEDEYLCVSVTSEGM